MSGSAVGNNNQYVDTGLSYMTRRRQGGREVAGSWLGRFLASLGGCRMIAAFHQLITRSLATNPRRRLEDRVVLSVLVLNRDITPLFKGELLRNLNNQQNKGTNKQTV
jgi:hypothetical protein